MEDIISGSTIAIIGISCGSTHTNLRFFSTSVMTSVSYTHLAQMFQAIIEDRNAPKVETSIDGYSGFLSYDDNGMPLVAMHWQHRFNHMVGRYNDIYLSLIHI